MQRRYIVVFDRFDRNGGFWAPQVCGRYRNLKSAVAHAERIADRHQQATRYRRAWDRVVVERDGKTCHECQDRIVPSVGELGWTP